MDKATRNYDSSASGNVQKEVERLISEGKTSLTLQDYERLRRKYPDDNTLYEKVMEAFTERSKAVRRTARKFYNLIMKNVLEGSTSGRTLYSILSLSKEYAKQNELTEAEFEEFRRLVEMKLSSGVDEQDNEDKGLFPSTNVTSFSKLLGTVAVESNNGLQMKDSDFGVLDEISKIYSTTRTLHASVIIQSMLHQDCSAVALNGRYDSNKHNPGIYVNPLIFALFVPKFDSVDERMLMSNMAGVVMAKHKKESIATLPDYRLFYALVTDRNDVVCDSESPIKDLRNRMKLQHHLWNSVIALRAGKYFDMTAGEFVSSIDACKFSVYTPEVQNMGDEALILKRLFATFSFNPVTVVSQPVYSAMQYAQYNSLGYHQDVYSVPYLQINVPPASALTSPLSVTDVLQQNIYEFQNNQFVQRVRSVYSVDEVLAVVFSRKFKSPRMPNANSPFFVALPLTVNGYETINQTEVTCAQNININNDAYELKSAVYAELMVPVVNTNNAQLISVNEIVIGTSAIVSCGGRWLAYKPVLVNTAMVSGTFGSGVTAPTPGPVYAPSSPITPLSGSGGIETKHDELINKRGLVVFYKKSN
jgi:hypothetical protein